MRKKFLDFCLSFLFAALFELNYLYFRERGFYLPVLVITAVGAVGFFVMGLREKTVPARVPPVKKRLSELVLLSEEERELRAWELLDRTALLIGRDAGENHVDVDLSEAAYAGMIDVEHAVLNYSGEDWYIEDLGSENGIGIRPVSDGKRYRLSGERPCKLNSGDVIYIAKTKLLVR